MTATSPADQRAAENCPQVGTEDHDPTCSPDGTGIALTHDDNTGNQRAQVVLGVLMLELIARMMGSYD